MNLFTNRYVSRFERSSSLSRVSTAHPALLAALRFSGAEEVLPGKAGDLLADLLPMTSRDAVVHPSVDTGIEHLLQRLRETAVGAHYW